MNRFSTALIALLLILGASTPAATPDEQAATALGVAQEFVDGYYHQFPEEAFEIAYPDTPMDSLGDRSEDVPGYRLHDRTSRNPAASR